MMDRGVNMKRTLNEEHVGNVNLNISNVGKEDDMCHFVTDV